MNKPRSFAPIIAALLLLLPVLYVGSYFALVVPKGIKRSRVVVGSGQLMTLVTHEYYRIGGNGWAESLYWPLEQIDRKLLRPRMWAFRDMIQSARERAAVTPRQSSIEFVLRPGEALADE